MSQDKILNFLYNTLLGRIIMKFIIEKRFFSKLCSVYYKSKFSRSHIPLQCRHLYDNFNDYFSRKEIRNDMSKTPKELISPADSLLSILSISDDLLLNIKGVDYTLEEITQLPSRILNQYKNGVILIYRLTVNDYHRYHFIDDGVLIIQNFIKGQLHTVRPLYSHNKCYRRNCRNVSILETKNFGEVINIEVGALLIGKIVNYKIIEFHKMMEKGYFEFGGSTIIQIFKPNCINIYEKYIKQTEQHVIAGETIGISIK